MLKILFFVTTFSLSAQQAFGFAGEFQRDDLIPSTIRDVKIKVYNMANNPGGRASCGESQCFRADILLNDVHVATWATNGGKSPIALHCGHVTGRKESHGCIRMVCNDGQEDAYVLSQWVKEAFRNGGSARLWTRDVR